MSEHDPSRVPPQELEPKIEFSPNEKLVKKLQVLGLHPDTVYVPCFGNDISPSSAFSDAKIVYVEYDESLAQALKAQGFDARQGDATTFLIEGGADVVILINPAIGAEGPARNVRPGGYFLCNDYHSTAKEMRTLGDQFTLKGMIRKDTRTGEEIFDPDVDPYWNNERVETDEEFAEVAPIEFAMAKRLVEARFGTDQPILERYKEILDEGIQPRFGGELVMTQKNMPLGKLPPRKKGHLDDLFVFQRIEKEGQNSV